MRFIRQVFKRRVDVEIVFERQALHHAERIRIAFVPTFNRARCERQARMRDHALGVKKSDIAQTIAFRTRAHWVVERKQTRLQLGNRIIATDFGTGEFRAEQLLDIAVHIHRERAPIGKAQRSLETLCQTLFQIRIDFDAIHHDFNRVFVVFFQGG